MQKKKLFNNTLVDIFCAAAAELLGFCNILLYFLSTYTTTTTVLQEALLQSSSGGKMNEYI